MRAKLRTPLGSVGKLALILTTGAFVAITVALVGCPSNIPIPQPVEGTVDVFMEGIAFVPSQVTIKRGESVRWTNRDGVRHTTTSGRPGDSDAGKIWDSSIMDPGQSFTHQFNEVGEFIYFCELHPLIMRDAKVTVVEAE